MTGAWALPASSSSHPERRDFANAFPLQNLLPIQETEGTQIPSLGREDPLEVEMATHSSILAWGIPWTEESGRLPSMGSQRVGHNLVTE